MIPEHITSSVPPGEARAWLIDGWGKAHGLGAERTLIGRRGEVHVAILNASVSRQHATVILRRGVWTIRDLGSHNGTRVNGRRAAKPAALEDGTTVQLGEVALYFVSGSDVLPPEAAPTMDTATAGDGRTTRFRLRRDGAELCLLGGTSEEAKQAGGVALFRSGPDGDWQETSLSALEFQLVRLLVERLLEERDSPSSSRGCVPTKELARLMPFQSKYANEENVRQIVRRVRNTLRAVGAEDVIMSRPGRGYCVSWELGDG